MKRTELAYMAGIFDGEGCISITRVKGKTVPKYYLVCQVHMANEYMINLFRFCFRGSIFNPKKREPHHKQMWQWICTGRIAQVFLETLLPYLRLKRAEAELGIELQKSVSSHKGSAKITDKQIAVREAQKILMSSLKKESIKL